MQILPGALEVGVVKYERPAQSQEIPGASADESYEITCPHCFFIGAAFVDKEKWQIKTICPRCGNTVKYRRKRWITT